jgi:hypothetical protein
MLLVLCVKQRWHGVYRSSAAGLDHRKLQPRRAASLASLSLFAVEQVSCVATGGTIDELRLKGLECLAAIINVRAIA